MAAEGAARVLQGDLASAATRIEVELAKRRYLAIGAQSSIAVTPEDEKEIAASVSAPTWGRVVAAKLVIQDEQENSSELEDPEVLAARKHLFVARKGTRLSFEKDSLDGLREAIEALEEITGTYSDE